MGTREELLARLELGLKRYNHGVRVDDDTKKWGTPRNSWLDMAKEELLDAIIYVLADYIRQIRSKTISCSCTLHCRQNDELDDNKLIISLLDEPEYIESAQHKTLIWNLFKMLDSNIFKD